MLKLLYMKWFWGALILGLILAFAFKKDLNNFNNNNMDSDKNNAGEVFGYKTFDCSEIGGFSFKFPDFKGWEFKYVEKIDVNLCIIYFNWPDDIEYEVPPAIEVKKVDLENISQTKKQNPQNISYEYIQDSSIYVDGHKFAEGDWDWLVFYGKDFNVRIARNMFGEPPFDADLFYSKIIETFDFK